MPQKSCFCKNAILAVNHTAPEPTWISVKYQNMRKSRDYIYGIWEYHALSYRDYFRMEPFVGENDRQNMSNVKKKQRQRKNRNFSFSTNWNTPVEYPEFYSERPLGAGFRSVSPAERWPENPARALARAGFSQHLDCGIHRSESSPKGSFALILHPVARWAKTTPW